MDEKILFLFRAHKLTFLAVALLSVLLITNSAHLPSASGEVKLLFPASSEALTLLEYERENFEDVYTDVILLKLDNDTSPFTLDDLEEELFGLTGISSVLMPKEEGPLNELFGLKTKDGAYGRIILKIDTKLKELEKAKLNREIKAILDRYPQLTPKRAGSFVTTREVSNAVTKETSRVIPWIIVVLLGCLALLFRDLKVTLVILGTTSLSLLTVLFSYGALGYPLGPISQLAPPFLLAVSASFNVHFTARILQTENPKRGRIIGELRAGILLAAFTTALSLATLYLLNVEDVTRFALLSAFGVLLSAAYAIWVPWEWLKGYQLKTKSLFAFSEKLPLFSYRKGALYLTGVICAVLAFGMSRLTVDTDPLSFLPKKDKALSDINAVNLVIRGNHYLSLLISSSSEIELSKISKLKTRLIAMDDVTRAITPYDFHALIAKTHAKKFFSDFSLNSSPIPEEFLSLNKLNQRILIETSLEGKALITLKERILLVAENSLKDVAATTGVTSLELIMAEQTTHIVHGLIQSLATTLLGVFLLLLFIFKDIRVALIGLTPNVLPLLSVFGLLGFLSNKLDFGSCLVGTSALGIAVDNTFHFLLCWKNKINNHNMRVATIETIRTTASPFTITTTSLVVAFSVMAIARSEPVMHFGVFLAVTLIVGLFADLVILPLLLIGAKPAKPPAPKK